MCDRPANTAPNSEVHPNATLAADGMLAEALQMAEEGETWCGASSPFLFPPLMGGMVLATSKKTKDRKFPLGAYPPWPEGRVWW